MMASRFRSTTREPRLFLKALCLFSFFLLFGGSVYAQTCSGMSLGNGASLNGFVPFPSTNAWNTNIASAPVDPHSAAIMAESDVAGIHLHPDFGAESQYGIPYVVVDSTKNPDSDSNKTLDSTKTRPVPINVIDYPSESDVVVAPYPITAPIEGNPADCSGWPDTYNGDAHVLVLDRAKCELYETFNTNRCNGQWDASSETIWDMKNYEHRPYTWTSADAAGLPIFPGLVRYDEVAAGAIHHAIRMTMRYSLKGSNGGYFVDPATHAAGNSTSTSIVMGMRFRLKSSFDISGFSPVNRVILKAMQQYGMIVADNGSSFFFQGASDPRFSDDDLGALKTIDSSNFEVVQATPELPGYDSATAPTGPPPTINSYRASASRVRSEEPVTFTYSASGDSYDYIDMIGPIRAHDRRRHEEEEGHGDDRHGDDRIGPIRAHGGSVTIYPEATQTYTLYSTNAYGRTVSRPITVTVPGSKVADPIFTLPGGTYSSPQTVTIDTSTSPSATIYYTTDGSTPTIDSTVYTGPITVASSEELKAIATATGYPMPSRVSSATYTISSLP